MTPYYADEYVTLYHGDCREVLPTLPPCDLVFTSPPFNLAGAPWPHLGNWKPGDSVGGKSKWRNGSDAAGGVTYDAHDDAMPHGEYVKWQRSVISMLWYLIPDDGAIFYNHKPRVIGARCWLPLELMPGHVTLRQIVIWARAGGMNFTPVAFVPTHEWLMVFAKPDWRLRSQAASGAGDVWRVPQEANPLHPAPFPAALPARAIEATSPRLVLDPFAGSGSTLRAAKDAGVRSIGIEKSELYCERTAQRLSQHVLDLGGAA